jgi:hypothetical protein
MPVFGSVFRRNPVEGCRFRQIRRPAHGTRYLQRIISLVSKSLDWVVNISSLIAAQVRPVFDLGKDAAFPSGGSIMTTHPSNHAGTSSSASTNTAPPETRRQQSLWSGIGASRLREALAEMVKATKPSAPAIDFGRYVRREVDLAPDSAAGVLAMGKFLRLDPVGKAIENCETSIQELRDETAAIRRQRPSRRKKRYGGRGEKKDADYWLSQLQEAVMKELKVEGFQRKEVHAQLVDRVYSLAADDLARAICDRFGKKKKQKIISGRTIRRGDTQWQRLPNGKRKKTGVTYHSTRYEEWKSHRIRAGVESELVGGSCDDAAGGDSDNRAVSLFDGSNKAVTRRDATLDEVRDKKMTAHAGGRGTLRLRKAKDNGEEHVDRVEQDADELLRSAGLNPDNVRG